MPALSDLRVLLGGHTRDADGADDLAVDGDGNTALSLLGSRITAPRVRPIPAVQPALILDPVPPVAQEVDHAIGPRRPPDIRGRSSVLRDSLRDACDMERFEIALAESLVAPGIDLAL
jgi:hypothetical protein